MTEAFIKSVLESDARNRKRQKRNRNLAILILIVSLIVLAYSYIMYPNLFKNEAEATAFTPYSYDETLTVSHLAEKEIDNIKLQKKIQEFLDFKRHQNAEAKERENLIATETLRQEKLAAEAKRKKDLADAEARKKKEQNQTSPNRGESVGMSKGEFNITAYDLSVQSCGKKVGSKGYGMTASGYSLVGHTRASAMAVAADKNMFPFGTRLQLTFTTPGYEKYNGIYTVRDRGGAIKGKRIDLFFGDFGKNEVEKSVMQFGRAKAIIKVVK